MRFLLTIAALVCTGCGSSAPEDSDGVGDTDVQTPEPGFGTLAASFGIDSDWRDNMDEPATGPFWGSVYNADEVSAIGPDEGAEALANLYVASVDLTGDLSTAVLVTTEELPEGWVTILGFMDSDGNAIVDDEDPDSKDPVTLPGQNEFEVIRDVESEVEIFFGLLNP